MMSKLTRVWLVVVITAVLIMGVTGMSAGQQRQAGPGKGMNPEAIGRSRAIQAELARIEANKEACVDEMLGRWASYVAPEVDLWGQVKSVAMAATPWRLLGASLTTDFESGFRVLRGVVGPGTYIGPYIQGETLPGSGAAQGQAGATDPADLLGATGDSLVFTPIPPCRVVDTRGTGARTGMIPAGTGSGRFFDFSQAGLAKGQGGQTSCVPLPVTNVRGWAVNVTVTGYSAIGHLTVEPYGGGLSPTSFMNFFPTAYAVANAGAVTGCVGCSESVYVHVSTATHVIIDVTGYYSEAVGFVTGAVSELAGTTVNLPAGGVGWVDGAVCPAGTALVGGSGANNGIANILTSDHHFFAGRWSEYQTNTGASTNSTTVYSICMDKK